MRYPFVIDLTDDRFEIKHFFLLWIYVHKIVIQTSIKKKKFSNQRKATCHSSLDMSLS